MKSIYTLKVPVEKKDIFCQGEYITINFEDLEELVKERDKLRLKGWMAYRSE